MHLDLTPADKKSDGRSRSFCNVGTAMWVPKYSHLPVNRTPRYSRVEGPADNWPLALWVAGVIGISLCSVLESHQTAVGATTWIDLSSALVISDFSGSSRYGIPPHRVGKQP